jgi:hypothetical protein
LARRGVPTIRAAGAHPALLTGPHKFRFNYMFGAKGSLRCSPTPPDAVDSFIVDRTSITEQLIREAQRLHPTSITFLFETAVESLDFGNRVVTCLQDEVGTQGLAGTSAAPARARARRTHCSVACQLRVRSRRPGAGPVCAGHAASNPAES